MMDRTESDRQVVELFASALQHHQRGHLGVAHTQYQAVLARAPNHADSLHHLGIIALQTGRHEQAVELIGRAIALNPAVPDFHYNIGIAYGSLGRFEQAVTHNRAALRLKPEHGPALMNLGKALVARGRLDEAIASYESAVAVMPRQPEPHFNLGNALAQSGRRDEAVARYREALALQPAYIDAHNNLGTVLAEQGKLDEAVACYEQALQLNPGLPLTEINLGNALRDKGETNRAADHYRRALQIDPGAAEAHNNLGAVQLSQNESAGAYASFQQAVAARPNFAAAWKNLGRAAQVLGDMGVALDALGRAYALEASADTRFLLYAALTDARAIPHTHRHRDLLAQAIAEPWGDPRDLMPAAVNAIVQNPQIDKWLGSGGPVLEAATLQEIARDLLLQSVLATERTASEDLERLLTDMRAALLEMAVQAAAAYDEHLLALHCALARQCFLVEYVFARSDAESQQVAVLRARIAAALHAGSPVQPAWLASVASYLPLHRLPEADGLLARDWPASVAAVIEQQIRVPREVARAAETIPSLTPIEDAVSQRVGQQYEENPYPRWEKLAPIRQPQLLGAYLRNRFPRIAISLDDASGCDYLIAGCGTGRHVAMVAQQFSGLRLTAIDLSRASLGYAKHKTDGLGLRDIGYAQADLLTLGSAGKTFDVIDASGVLHHMADPLAGWRALVVLLRPQGCMRLGLYSEIARRSIVSARRLIADRGYGQDADAIRRCRQDLLALPEGAPERAATKSWDFYSTSDCRDLLFHTQEHRLSLLQIAEFLAGAGLRFIGFEVDAATQQQYAARFPDVEARTSLDNWHAFEQDHPDTFKSMYQFWVQHASGG